MTTKENLTTAELRETVEIARQNMIEAWRSQSQTTAEEGYNREQVNAAIAQAVQAEQVYSDLYNELEKRYCQNITPDSHLESEYEEAADYTPMGGW